MKINRIDKDNNEVVLALSLEDAVSVLNYLIDNKHCTNATDANDSPKDTEASYHSPSWINVGDIVYVIRKDRINYVRFYIMSDTVVSVEPDCVMYANYGSSRGSELSRIHPSYEEASKALKELIDNE